MRKIVESLIDGNALLLDSTVHLARNFRDAA